MNEKKEPCPLCGADARLWIKSDIYEFECPRCGWFATLDSPRLFRIGTNLRPVSTFTREETLKRGPTPLLGFDYTPEVTGKYRPASIKEIVATYWPQSIGDRLDRALVNLGKLSEYAGMRVSIKETDDALLYAKNCEEMLFVLDSLVETSLIDKKPPVTNANGVEAHGALCMVVVRAAGWRRVNELQSAAEREKSKRVFVAMWFDEETNAAFQEGISLAIRDDCGFDPKRIDLTEFNEDVVAEIYAEIRSSRFVVADLTGHRLGVYFEAGYAKGLGLPVIFTCRDDALKSSHFDVRNYNTVVWHDPEELRRKLTNRIRGTITGAKLA